MKNKKNIARIAFVLTIMTVFPSLNFYGQEPPVLSGIETSTITYTENDPNTPVTNTIIVSDADNTELASATIQIMGIYNGQDVLYFTDNYGITGNWNSTNGTMTLTGPATLENFQNALRSVHYGNISENPDDMDRNVNFIVNDGTSSSATVTRVISFTAVNDAPVLSDIESEALLYTENEPPKTLSASISATDPDTNYENFTITVNVSNNYNSGQDVLSFENFHCWTGSWNSSNGTLTITGECIPSDVQDALQIVRYSNTSDNPSTATRTVTFTVNDGTDSSLPVTRNINITEVNDPPVSVNDSYTVDEGDTRNVSAPGVLGNDTDAEGNTLTATLVSSPANGSLTLNSNGSFTYTHNGSETTSDQFTYRVSDADPGNTATVSITITPGNDPPVSVNDSYTVAEGATLNISAPGVLGNDTDTEDDPLTAILVTSPSNGSLTLNSNGSFTYIHNGSETTSDQFTYRASDGTQGNIATVSLTITPVNDPPVSVNDSYTVAEGATLNISAPGVLNNDTDTEGNPITAILVSNPSNGSLTLNANGSFTYIHNGSESASDQFTYRATDGTQGNTATVSLTITPVNDLPVSVNDSYTVAEGATLNISAPGVLGNDTDSEGSSLTAVLVSNPSNGSLTLNANGSFAYIHNGSETTSDQFTYRASDGAQGNIATVSLTITPVNDPPVTVNDSYTVAEGATLNISAPGILENDTDTEENPLTAVLISNPSNGSLTLNSNGSFTYIHNGSETTSDQFTYRAYDANPGNTATVSLTITPVNDPPVLDDIETTTLSYNQGDGEIAITAEITAADPDNTMMAGAIVSITNTFDKNEDRLIYTPANGINGTFNTNTGVLSLNGSSSVANYQTQLRSIRYENISTDAPTVGTRVIRFVLDDGTHDSEAVSRNISVNSLPVLAGIETSPLIYCRNSGPVQVTSTITVSDPNDFELTGATISITGSFTSSEDVLEFTAPLGSGITGSYNSSNGILTLSGKSLVSNYQLALRSVRYRNTDALSPQGGNRIINFTVNDGKKSSNPVSRIVTISLPAAVISGSASICEYTSTNLSVSITGGTAPWKFSYRRNAETPVEVLNVTSSPYLISVAKAGTYTLTEITDDNGCTGTVSGSAIISVTQAPEVTISGLLPAYNLDNLAAPFDTALVSPSGGVLENITKSGNVYYQNGMWIFYPTFAGVGTFDLVYRYQSQSTGCFGYDTVEVRVLEANADIVFPDNRTFYCTNDDYFTITGVNVVNDIGSFEIEGGSGLHNNGDNTATINPHVLSPGIYTITYSYFDGTTLSVTRDILIGNPPLASFNWETECYIDGQSVNLINNSTSGSGIINSYKWKFYKPSGYDSLMTMDAIYSYPQPGNYDIELQITTTNACADTIRRTLPLRPTISLAEDSYYENFEEQPLSWQSAPAQQGGVNSWELGIPSKGFSGSATGPNCWYTYIPTTNAPREQSMITSPCFDFSETERPMIKLDIWRLFNATRDGAVLQASADSGRTWQNIGELQDGINWYNETTVLGNPGGQSTGWSNIRDAGWLEARHSLDQLIGKELVQFRIAYGSDGTARNTDGIAIDDFWIGERNRIALIEHFTNSSDAVSKAANQMLNEAMAEYPQNMIDLQYHASFPGTDPLNLDNPTVPESRMLYYGLTTVPYSILDGGTKSSLRFDYDLRPLDVKTLLIQSLYDSKFWINLHSTLEGDQVIVNAEVMALEPIPLAELTLHLVVIEEKVTEVTGSNGETEFRSVVKAMLPNAAGTNFYKEWSLGEYQYVNHNWQYDNVYDAQQLRIVAFMQNEQTKEVYQASADTVQVLSGISPDILENPAAKSFIIYPDPASTVARIRFTETLAENLTLEIFNNTGGLVYSELLTAGGDNFTLPVEILPDGIYLVRVTDSKGFSGTAKFTINR